MLALDCSLLRFKPGADKAFQTGQSNWLASKVSPYSCLDINIYLPYDLCCVINFNTLVGCSSIQYNLKNESD